MPGHMRACKKAMGDLLTDSAFDARVYKSAQNYTDNVIDVTKPYAVEARLDGSQDETAFILIMLRRCFC